MTDHTPGPWTCDDCEVCGRLYFEVYGSGIQVGSIYPAATADKEMMVEANAHLIAAAPELLAVLKQLVRNKRELPTEMMWEKAEGVVAKATGGAS